MIEALDIRVRGIVQGVGFRPFVYRLARRYLVNGWVLNSREGVFIHAEAEGKLLDEFVMEISDNAPAAAVVREIELHEVPLQDCTGFEIRESVDAQPDRPTLVSADLATCDDCLYELFDPGNRRYRYPFINCTNCGPRFTIIDGLPYDRPATSMSGFVMCPDCAREYADPADRRFHAQPDACWDCGPHVSLYGDLDALAGLDPSVAQAVAALESAPLARACPGDGRADGSEEPNLAASPHPDVAEGAVAGENPETRGGSDVREGSGAREGQGPCIAWGNDRESSDAIFSVAVKVLSAGGILAVKGLGGFHLVCDAANEDALARLRAGKHRDGKAFAVMVSDVAAAHAVCLVNDAEADQLMSSARPIVLLRRRPDAHLAAGLAGTLPELGVMLPTTPVQHLLLNDFRVATGRDMLVMTSGNMHDEPIAIDDADAFRRLSGVADAFIGNDRQILARYDDSVVRVLDLGGTDQQGEPLRAVQFIRRARGYAPVPIAVPVPAELAGGDADRAGAGPDSPDGAGSAAMAPVVFAAGPEQKNTFAFLCDGQAFVSQHVGDVEDADVFDAWLDARARFSKLFDLSETRLACDAHPEYLSSKWAREQARQTGMPLVEVQHHHAHVASVLGEHGLFGPACGIAFDGTGYGADGCIWGGEVLLANQVDYERFANFGYVPMPGGAAAIKNPLRMAYGALWQFDLLEHPAVQQALAQLGDAAVVCEQMIDRGINTPMTSSVGRLFDAASALCGVCVQPTYEGEAAVLFDAARAEGEVDDATRARYAIEVAKNVAVPESTAHDTSVLLLDAAPTFAALLDDLQAGVPVPQISLRFHDAFVGAVVQAAELVRALYDINLVVLSGGVFMNRYLVQQSARRLGEAGFTVALGGNLPPNDGCISYGQAIVARARR